MMVKFLFLFSKPYLSITSSLLLRCRCSSCGKNLQLGWWFPSQSNAGFPFLPMILMRWKMVPIDSVFFNKIGVSDKLHLWDFIAEFLVGVLVKVDGIIFFVFYSSLGPFLLSLLGAGWSCLHNGILGFLGSGCWLLALKLDGWATITIKFSFYGL